MDDSNAANLSRAQAGIDKQHRETLREEIEMDLIGEAIYRYYGFDFRQYARASFKRRVKNLLVLENLPSISALLERLLYDKQMMERFLLNLSVNVTAMFRDPKMYHAFREKVVPILHTYSTTRIWHAGCSSGEEAFSTSILLDEEGVRKRSKIYATDFNEAIIKRAKKGIIPLRSMQEYTENYHKSGGTKSFSEYYTAQHDSAILSPEIRKPVVFSKHNLAIDGSFNEFNVIFCRNVMIYFNEELRNKVLMLLHNSLCRFGILILGMKENLKFTPLNEYYKDLDSTYKIYQRLD
jgi:chemotaxis protein methyltransferase CheR